MQHPAIELAVEFLVTMLPMMISFTRAELAVPLLVSVYCLAAIFSALSWQHAKEYIHKHCRKEKMNQLLGGELPFLTNFRGQIMLSTYDLCSRCSRGSSDYTTCLFDCWVCRCFAILAVDFTAFPRRFAKTETFGFSVVGWMLGCRLHPWNSESNRRLLTS